MLMMRETVWIIDPRVKKLFKSDERLDSEDSDEMLNPLDSKDSEDSEYIKTYGAPQQPLEVDFEERYQDKPPVGTFTGNMKIFWDKFVVAQKAVDDFKTNINRARDSFSYDFFSKLPANDSFYNDKLGEINEKVKYGMFLNYIFAGDVDKAAEFLATIYSKSNDGWWELAMKAVEKFNDKGDKLSRNIFDMLVKMIKIVCKNAQLPQQIEMVVHFAQNALKLDHKLFCEIGFPLDALLEYAAVPDTDNYFGYNDKLDDVKVLLSLGACPNGGQDHFFGTEWWLHRSRKSFWSPPTAIQRASEASLLDHFGMIPSNNWMLMLDTLYLKQLVRIIQKVDMESTWRRRVHGDYKDAKYFKELEQIPIQKTFWDNFIKKQEFVDKCRGDNEIAKHTFAHYFFHHWPQGQHHIKYGLVLHHIFDGNVDEASTFLANSFVEFSVHGLLSAFIDCFVQRAADYSGAYGPYRYHRHGAYNILATNDTVAREVFLQMIKKISEQIEGHCMAELFALKYYTELIVVDRAVANHCLKYFGLENIENIDTSLATKLLSTAMFANDYFKNVIPLLISHGACPNNQEPFWGSQWWAQADTPIIHAISQAQFIDESDRYYGAVHTSKMFLEVLFLKQLANFIEHPQEREMYVENMPVVETGLLFEGLTDMREYYFDKCKVINNCAGAPDDAMAKHFFSTHFFTEFYATGPGPWGDVEAQVKYGMVGEI